MDTKDVVEVRIKKKAIIDMDSVYNCIADWGTSYDIDFAETTYKHKEPIQHVWEGEKKLTPYFKMTFKVHMWLFGATDVDVKLNGKKVKRTKTTISILLKSDLILDYNEAFEKSFFHKKLEKIYNEFIIKPIVTKHKTMIYKWTYELHDKLKELLEMEGA